MPPCITNRTVHTHTTQHQVCRSPSGTDERAGLLFDDEVLLAPDVEAAVVAGSALQTVGVQHQQPQAGQQVGRHVLVLALLQTLPCRADVIGEPAQRRLPWCTRENVLTSPAAYRGTPYKGEHPQPRHTGAHPIRESSLARGRYSGASETRTHS